MVVNAISGAKDDRMASILSDIGRLACRGWSNLLNAKGENVGFVEARGRDARVLGIEVRGCCAPDLWASIPISYRKELAEVVVGRVMSGLSEDTRKNS